MILTRKYANMEMAPTTRGLLDSSPRKFLSYCNGVGSQTGWFNKLIYHFIPNTIWGLDITPASDVHDVEYAYPHIFNNLLEALEFKFSADKRFKRNVFTLIDTKTRWEWLKRLRKARAMEYEFILRHCGEESFLSGKVFLKSIR